MMKWIDASSDVKPPENRPLLCYCPDWSEVGYQIAMWDGKYFYYDDAPNNGFYTCVEKWAVFETAD